MPKKTPPDRRSLPFALWPAGDQSAWLLARQGGDIIDGEGPAARWAEATKTTNQAHYGRWLGWLSWTGKLEATASPGDRVTPQAVGEYVKHLRAIVAPVTLLSMLVGLKVSVAAMAQERSWRWLQDACNRQQRVARPSRLKRLRVIPSGRIYRAAIDEMDRIGATDSLPTSIAFRDALMLALLTARPLRTKNLMAIQIGRHLLRQGKIWLLSFPADEVKNRVPLDFTVPDSLVPYLERYLNKVRPSFPGADASLQLWLSKDGPSLGRQFAYWRITKVTKRLLGSPLNPHLLRDCDATTLAVEAGDIVRSARPLLGHRHASTTSQYYVQASQLDASRKINAIIAGIVNEPRER